MKVKKEDRRVKYTKMVLKESFIDLLIEKDIKSITITEICENADINRATFYTHYADQYDLLKKIEDEFLENLKEYIFQFKSDKGSIQMVDILAKIFEYLKANSKLCKIIMSKQGDLEYQNEIMMMIYESDMPMKPSAELSKPEEPYLYAFIITGCVGVVQKWLDEGMKSSTKVMANVIFDTIKKLPVFFE